MAKEKKCKLCGHVGEEKEFASGRFRCLKCHEKLETERYHRDKDKHRAKRKEYRLENSDREKERANDWYYENKERAIKSSSERWKNNKEYITEQRQLRVYNLTKNELLYMKVRCDNKCEICKEEFDKMCVDHCHITGKVRGLLCHKCNCAIGFLKDEFSLVESAVQYLRKYSDKVIYEG